MFWYDTLLQYISTAQTMAMMEDIDLELSEGSAYDKI